PAALCDDRDRGTGPSPSRPRLLPPRPRPVHGHRRRPELPARARAHHPGTHSPGRLAGLRKRRAATAAPPAPGPVGGDDGELTRPVPPAREPLPETPQPLEGEAKGAGTVFLGAGAEPNDRERL